MKNKPRNKSRILVMDHERGTADALYKNELVWFDSEPNRGRHLDDFYGWMYISVLKKLMN